MKKSFSSNSFVTRLDFDHFASIDLRIQNERAPMTGLQMDNATAKAVNSVTNALLALNSAANFAVYCLVGKKFRRILRRRLCVAACVCVNAPSTVENGESVCCYYCNRRTASGRDFDAVTALERNTCTRHKSAGDDFMNCEQLL